MDEATAKMASEFGKSAGKELVGLAGGLGEFVAKTLGSIPADLLGLVGADWLHHTRAWRNAELQARAAKKIKEIGEDHVTPPSESIVVPLLQAAVKEGREELQELWANLLARAMTNNARGVRRAFIDVLGALEPDDALVLEIQAGFRNQMNNNNGDSSMKYLPYLEHWKKNYGITEDEYQYSYKVLRELDLLDEHGGLTHFGKLFYAACVVSPAHPA